MKDSVKKSLEAFASVSKATDQRLSEPEKKQADDSVRFLKNIIDNQNFDGFMGGDVPSFGASMPPDYIVDLTLRPPQVVMLPDCEEFSEVGAFLI